MKVKSIGKNLSAGFSTIEMLIAFAILIITLSSVIQVTFGNQSVSVDSQTNDEAVFLAQHQIEDARASSSHANFLDIVSATSSYNIYSRDTKVSDISPCSKQVTGTVSWKEGLRSLVTSFSTYLTDPAEAIALGGNCSSTPPDSNDWKKPNSLNANPAGMEGNGTGVDVKNKIIFLTTAAGGANKDDFFIIDATNKTSPVKKSSKDLSSGLEAIDVVGNYAYIANDENIGNHQLLVVNVTNLSAPSLVASSSLPGVTGSCPDTCPGGRSIYYYNNKIYIGTHRLTAGGAAEFHIFCLAPDPNIPACALSSPSNPVWAGSKGGALGDATDHNINSIVVRDQTVGGITRTYAYLATSNDSGEIVILNVSNPSSIPDPVGTLSTGNIKDIAGDYDATSISVIGNRLYVGRARAISSAESDFIIFDISNPALPILIGSKNIGLNSSSSHVCRLISDNGPCVSGISLVGNIAFLGTSDPNDPFEVWDVSNPSNITRWENVGCEINFSTFVTGMTLENNLIYVSLDAKGQNPKIIEPINGSGGTCH